MQKNEEEKEDIPKLHPKIVKMDDSSIKNKKAHLKIEISQIHTIEDDDFIIKPNKQETPNYEIKAPAKPDTSIMNDFQANKIATNDDNITNAVPEIMNDNEKNTIIYQSIKELNYISHPGFPDINASTFAPQMKKPFWPENLWKGGTLIYSYKNPEKSLGPPIFKNDKTIRFNSRFESGNLMYAYRLNADTYHCILEYDHTPQGQCQWFYFQMSNIKLNPNSTRKTTFYISGFNKSNGVFSNGSRVFMYSEKLAKFKKISWYRAGTSYAYSPTLKKPGGSSKRDKDKKNGKNKSSKNKRSTLQFQVTFPYDDDVVYFCYALPYTYTDLKQSISRWTFNKPTIIKEKILCKTYGGKDCPILTITAENSPSDVTKRCIFITARIHPGESNGSIVLHGLIDFLLSPQPITAYLLDHFIFQIVPMINIDGVIEGYYRVGLEGDDLNRVWSDPDEIRHPVVYHTKKLMERLNREIGIVAYIDFHGHSRQHGTFAYGCPWDPSENLPSSFIGKEKVFPRMLAFLCDAFSFDKCVFSIPPERKDASRCVIRRELGVVHSFTIESSFGGFCSGPRRNTLYCESSWKEIGARVAEALFHLLASEGSPLSKLIDPNSSAQLPIGSNSAKMSENIGNEFNESPVCLPSKSPASLVVSHSVDENDGDNDNDIDGGQIGVDIDIVKPMMKKSLNAKSKLTLSLNNESPVVSNDKIPMSLNSCKNSVQNDRTNVSLNTSKNSDKNDRSSASLNSSKNSGINDRHPVSLNTLKNSGINDRPFKVDLVAAASDGHNEEKILNCLVELAHKEMKKQELNQMKKTREIEKEALHFAKKTAKLNSNVEMVPNQLKTKNGAVFTITSFNTNSSGKVKQRSKSTVKSITLHPSSFNAVAYFDESVAQNAAGHSSQKNQKQKQKNMKQKKMNEKPFQSKQASSSKNKTKTLHNLTKTNLMASPTNTSKVIKSPRLSKSMKVIKNSRINRSNSVK